MAWTTFAGHFWFWGSLFCRCYGLDTPEFKLSQQKLDLDRFVLWTMKFYFFTKRSMHFFFFGCFLKCLNEFSSKCIDWQLNSLIGTQFSVAHKGKTLKISKTNAIKKKHDQFDCARWTKRVYISIKTELRSTVALAENHFVCWVCACVSECFLYLIVWYTQCIYMYISFMCIVYPHFVFPNASPLLFRIGTTLWHFGIFMHHVRNKIVTKTICCERFFLLQFTAIREIHWSEPNTKPKPKPKPSPSSKAMCEDSNSTMTQWIQSHILVELMYI